MVLIKQLVQAGYTREQRIAETYAHKAYVRETPGSPEWSTERTQLNWLAAVLSSE